MIRNNRLQVIISVSALIICILLSGLSSYAGTWRSPEIKRLFHAGDSLRMKGDYPAALRIYQQLDTLIDHKDIEAYCHLLDSRSCLYDIMGYHMPMLEDIRKQLSIKKPDSLLHLDVMAYLGLTDFYGKYSRYTLARKYLEKAFSIADKYKASNPRKFPLYDMMFCLYEGKIQLLIINDSLEKALTAIDSASQYAFTESRRNSLKAHKAQLLSKNGKEEEAAVIYDSIIRQNDLTFDHRASIGSHYIRLLLKNQNITKARDVLNYLQPHTRLSFFQQEWFYLSSLVEEQEGNTVQALHSLRRSKELSDSLDKEWSEAMAAIEADHFEMTMVRDELELKRKENLRKTLLIICLLIGLTLTGGITVYIFKRHRIIKIQKDIAEKKLGNRIGEVSRLTSQLKTLNRSREDIYEIIASDKDNAEKEARLKETLRYISSAETDNPTDYDETSAEFESRLIILHPDLSKAEIRMALMTLSGLPNKDIAASSNRSLSTVKYTKYQLRKKLGITTTTEEYLRKIASLSEEDFARMARTKSSL